MEHNDKDRFGLAYAAPLHIGPYKDTVKQNPRPGMIPAEGFAGWAFHNGAVKQNRNDELEKAFLIGLTPFGAASAVPNRTVDAAYQDRNAASPTGLAGWSKIVGRQMRYFFHVREGQELSRDQEGQELADVEAARREATNISREIMGEKLLHGGPLNGRTIEIADETGCVVDTVSSREVVIAKGTFRTLVDDAVQSAPKPTP